MLLRISLLLFAALGTSVQAADGVWKWVDAQGVTHYADRPVPGAVQVDMKVQSRAAPPAPPAANSAAPTTQAATTPVADPYTQIEIWKPVAEETVTNTGGLVAVRVRLTPAIRPRHTLALYLDGKRVENLAPGALDVELQDVPRGTHSLVASVFDDAGKVVQRGQQVVFFVRQESAAQPPVGPTLRPPRKP